MTKTPKINRKRSRTEVFNNFSENSMFVYVFLIDCQKRGNLQKCKKNRDVLCLSMLLIKSSSYFKAYLTDIRQE